MESWQAADLRFGGTVPNFRGRAIACPRPTNAHLEFFAESVGNKKRL